MENQPFSGPDPDDHIDPSSSGTNRPSSIAGIRHIWRPRQKVKFSIGSEKDAGADQDSSQLEAGTYKKPIADARMRASEDVTNIHLTSPNWLDQPTHPQHNAPSSNSEPGSRTHSRTKSRTNVTQAMISPYSSPPLKPITNQSFKYNDIPLESLNHEKRPYDINEDTATDDDSDDGNLKPSKRENENMAEARRLIRTLTNGPALSSWHEPRPGTETPAVDKHLHDLDYVPPPERYKPGILGAILSSKLHDLQTNGITRPDYANPYAYTSSKQPPANRKHERAGSDTQETSNQSSGRVTPSRKPKWYDKPPNQMPSGSVATLLTQASQLSTATAVPFLPARSGSATASVRPPMSRRSSGLISSAVDIIKQGASQIRTRPSQHEIPHHVVQEVAEILVRRKYLIRLCGALMTYGAPTHRMEEYMHTSARALQVEAEFLYMPGSMLCCFLDSIAYTTQVEMVRQNQGVDLGRFKDVFNVYKCVIHGKYDADEGLRELDVIRENGDLYPRWMRILFFGFAAVSVSPWAFGARPIDFPPIFVLGGLLGLTQLCVVPLSAQFSHVFEVTAAVVTSFVARGLGSIRWHGDGPPIFCFAAMAQSSIALLLPGYIMLCASLELQSRNMVSGSVRMVFAIIYTLFLGFGLLIGTTIYGLIDPKHAINDVTCVAPEWWDTSIPDYRLIYAKFIFVPTFTIAVAVINQAKWRQIPVMALISSCGYMANYWVSTRIAQNMQVANAIGAFVIGAMANLYSRFFHGLAAAAMLPAIFVQVPSGLAASGSLVAGLTSANQITGNGTGISYVNNGTQGFLDAQTANANDSLYNGTIFNVGYGMVQVAIGISVGLYLSALLVYPYGKRNSGLFSF